MPSGALELIGLVPAIFFPAASLVQLLAMLRRGNASGVSFWSWSMVGISNVCLFTYTQRYDDVITILALMGAAVLNFAVAFTALYYQRRELHEAS